MILTIIAVMCQTIPALPAQNPIEVCHEEIVAQEDMPIQACFMAQPAVAEWKERSQFRSGDWTVARIRCLPGLVPKRDMI